MIVVADTSPPLHLGRIGRLDLLPAVVGRVTVPRTVWGDLVRAGTHPGVFAALEATIPVSAGALSAAMAALSC